MSVRDDLPGVRPGLPPCLPADLPEVDGPVRLCCEQLASLRGLRLLFHRLDLEAVGGELVVLRGENGSGKSTLLRIMAGLMRPSLGVVRLDAPTPEPIHYAGHLNGLKPFETPRSALAATMAMAGQRADPSGVEAALAALGLTRPADVPARLLSAGQKRRMALARLLVVDRPVWLLDEPFASLDADGQVVAEAMIAGHLRRGGLVVAALHGQTALTPDRTLTMAPPEAGPGAEMAAGAPWE